MTEIRPKALKTAERIRVATGMGYFPVLANTADGAILAVYRAGAGHMGMGGYLVSSRSEDAGATWSEPATVVSTSEYDDRNPALGVAQDGSITVAYHANGMYDADGTYMEDRRDPKAVHTGLVRSNDHGRTWAAPMLWTDATEWDAMSPYGRILTLSDGTMAMPIYLETSCLLRSTNGGRSWGDLSLVGEEINETAFCVLPSGVWLSLGRLAEGGESGCMVTRTSDDGGRTWSTSTPFLTGLRLPADLLPLSNGSVLAVYGYRAAPCGARATLIHADGATVGSTELVLHDSSKSGDCGYPSAVLSDGWVVTAFYDAGECTTYDGANSFCELVRVREDELVDALM
jgi:hypothetical protein